MKLLLTSSGLTNDSIAKALFDLVGKKPKNTGIAFIPTAANVTYGDKSWFIKDLYNLQKQNLLHIDIVDISAMPKEVWLPRLEAADVLFFSGGNTTHLMNWVFKSGLDKLLPTLLKTRVYAGISAGSIAATPSLAFSNDEKRAWYKKQFGYDDDRALGFVDFYFRPHLDAPHHPASATKVITKAAKQVKELVYVLDDQSALVVIDDKVEVVSEGKYLLLNA